jgi:hypothetical protein
MAIIITTAPGRADFSQCRYVTPTGCLQDKQAAAIPGLKNIFLRTVTAFFSQFYEIVAAYNLLIMTISDNFTT